MPFLSLSLSICFYGDGVRCLMSDRDWNNSRPLDVHRWSDYMEVNRLVDQLMADQFADFTHKKTKNHVKVLLLDLYVCWLEDPDKSLGVGLSNRSYKARSRYNAIHISNLMIDVVHRFVDAGLAAIWKGNERAGKTSRIWATDSLIAQFKQAALDSFMVSDHQDRETIILRDEDKKQVEYDEASYPIDTRSKIAKMREQLTFYNDALVNTFIDIPTLDKGYIENVKDGAITRHAISDHHKHIHRVFNNSSFDMGGRFYGGWWQNIPKAYRQDIFIDDQSTIEVDFKSLHILLLYGLEGLDMDEALQGEDAYTINIPFENEPEQARKLGKLLLLIAINAKDGRTALQAFRSILVDEGYGGGITSLKDKDLLPLINALKDKHPKIAHKFCSNAGINLMNIDADVASFVLEECLVQDYVPLIMHDSFIVIDVFEEGLKHIMKAAIASVCSGTTPNFSQVKNERLYLSVFHEAEEADAYRSSRYKVRLARWKKLSRRRKRHSNAVEWPKRPTAY